MLRDNSWHETKKRSLWAPLISVRHTLLVITYHADFEAHGIFVDVCSAEIGGTDLEGDLTAFDVVFDAFLIVSQIAVIVVVGIVIDGERQQVVAIVVVDVIDEHNAAIDDVGCDVDVLPFGVVVIGLVGTIVKSSDGGIPLVAVYVVVAGKHMGFFAATRQQNYHGNQG